MKTRIQSLNLPASVLTTKQKRLYPARQILFRGERLTVRAVVRYDDQCGNGHNTFSITGDYKEPGQSWEQGGGGCCHDEIAAAFPELAPLIKWHLCSTDMPMHYVANTLYFAGERDHRGLLKGEFRQHTSRGRYQNGGVEGVLGWELRMPETQRVYSHEKPAPVTLEWHPCGTTGEGKKRELDAARRAAVWPDATDEDLTAPGLEDRLLARLPALMAEFKAAVESLGFTY